jgi:hypothetical protein
MSWFLIPAQPENVVRSLSNPVALEDLRPFLGDAESERLATLGDGEIRCWAMTGGTKAQFKKLSAGDHVLFSESGTGQFNYFAEVTDKVTSKALGDHLWPIKPRKSAKSSEQKSWEFIYFLKHLRPIEINKSMLMGLLGHEGDAVSGARQLKAEKLAGFEAVHGSLLQWLRTNAKLDLETPPPPPAIVEPEPPVPPTPQFTLGKDYIAAPLRPTLDVRERKFTYNAEEAERGAQAHNDTQDALAAFLRARGLVPRLPAPSEPQFDLAWMVGETVFIAEIKSTTEGNEEDQLRLGLGQVLRYWDLIADESTRVVAVLVPEGEPRARRWRELCERLGVRLAWPGEFERVFAPASGDIKASE